MHKNILLIHFNHSQSGSLTTWADMRTSKWKPNYGDMLVCASVVRQLASDTFSRIAFGDTSSAPSDLAVIRGSTYLHDQFDFAAACKTLDSLRTPAAIVGLGAQNPVADATFLDGNSGARDFIARLNERGASISVRGDFTASVVERLGGKNIRITGCPSLFYTLARPSIAVPELLATSHRRLGVSLHSGLSRNIFCHAPQQARAMHHKVIDFSIRNSTVTSLFEQGVMREFVIADRLAPFEERVEAAEGLLKGIQGDGSVSALDIVSRMVSVKSIEEWLAKARDLDAIVGFRFHGNMVALLQGSPCYYYTYDSRLEEFCQLYKLPYQDVTEEWRDPCEAMLEHDWAACNAAIAKCHQELMAFYAENNIPSTLTP